MKKSISLAASRPNMKRCTPDQYVYTMEAVRARLRRGYVNAFVFLPYTGRVVEVTTKNVEKVAKIFREGIRTYGK